MKFQQVAVLVLRVIIGAASYLECVCISAIFAMAAVVLVIIKTDGLAVNVKRELPLFLQWLSVASVGSIAHLILIWFLL